MYRVTFVSGLFRNRREHFKSNRVLQILLDALADIDLEWLRDHPHAPPIYRSGVIYRAEPLGLENWQDVATTLLRGHGDCEDLACWRAAELRLRGVFARPVFRWRFLPNGVVLYHILVQLPDGRIEDPSRQLGMGALSLLEPGAHQPWVSAGARRSPFDCAGLVPGCM